MPRFTPTRRQFIANVACSGLAMGASSLFPYQLMGKDSDSIEVDADHAIRRLKEGNERFISGNSKHVHSNKMWRDSLVTGQHPFAVIIGCSDSRVPIELLFDQGFGDLFTIRNAGNVIMADVIGSIEYAALHLNTKLVVVMGHEGCGAVAAALSSRKERMKEPEELQEILRAIDPAIKDLDHDDPDVHAKGVEANVQWSVSQIKKLKCLRNNPATKGIQVIGSVYNLHSSQVKLMV